MVKKTLIYTRQDRFIFLPVQFWDPVHQGTAVSLVVRRSAEDSVNRAGKMDWVYAENLQVHGYSHLLTKYYPWEVFHLVQNRIVPTFHTNVMGRVTLPSACCCKCMVNCRTLCVVRKCPKKLRTTMAGQLWYKMPASETGKTSKQNVTF